MSVNRVPEFYQYAIHLVYAVIIALSFDVAKDLFIPIQHFWATYENFENGVALLLVYVVIISGWIGWTKSIIDKPHKLNVYGNSRFVLDLFLGFLSFYLIQLAKPEYFQEFNQVFIWVMPGIFITYMIWDSIKYREYNLKDKAREIQTNRITKTLYGLIIVLIISLFYSNLLTRGVTVIVDGNNYLDLIFMIMSIALVLFYRNSKWKQIKVRKSRKPKDLKGKNNSNL